MAVGSLVGLAVLVFAIAYVLAGIKVCNEYERAVAFTLGRYAGIRGPGLYWLAPIFQWQRKVDTRTNTVDVERQETITKDSVTVKVNAVVWYRVFDPEKAILQVVSYNNATYQMALTSLRNVVGQHVLDEVLKERDRLNEALKMIIDTATDPWGIKVEAVEMKDVEIPAQMQRAMAQEAQAVREKRARIVKAEGDFDAAQKLADAAKLVTVNPMALELRRMQMITEVGAEQNTTTIVMMPSEFISAAEAFAARFGVRSAAGPDAVGKAVEAASQVADAEAGAAAVPAKPGATSLAPDIAPEIEPGT